jgi:molybdopterin-containing oxidoreductase family iron-sulfur binding subunit
MVIDLDKCTGCGACMVACQAENNVAIQTDASNKRLVTNWMLVFELSNGKSFPDHEVAYLPRPCMHCGNPSCVAVCPATVTTKDEEGGIVSQIYPRCFGCRYCMASCPYHARYFNWYDPVWPEGMEKTLSPDVSVRPRGVVEKCHFCHHRWMQAKDKARVAGEDPKALPQEAYQTACTQACPNGAITFGDLNNPEHTVHELAHSEYAFRLLERLGTEPQVYYMSRREWVRRAGDNYLADEKTGSVKNEHHS